MKQGASLPVIRSPANNQDLHALLVRDNATTLGRGTPTAWLGLSDSNDIVTEQGGGWSWVDGNFVGRAPRGQQTFLASHLASRACTVPPSPLKLESGESGGAHVSSCRWGLWASSCFAALTEGPHGEWVW